MGYLPLRDDKNDTSNLQENAQELLPPPLEELGENYHSLTWRRLSQSLIWFAETSKVQSLLQSISWSQR